MKDFFDEFPIFSFMGLLIVLIFVIMIMVSTSKSQPTPPPRPRFEQILREYADDDTKTTDIRVFEIWHDKESGIEFVCAIPHSTLASADKTSCFTTGRNWK